MELVASNIPISKLSTINEFNKWSNEIVAYKSLCFLPSGLLKSKNFESWFSKFDNLRRMNPALKVSIWTFGFNEFIRLAVMDDFPEAGRPTNIIHHFSNCTGSLVGVVVGGAAVVVVVVVEWWSTGFEKDSCKASVNDVREGDKGECLNCIGECAVVDIEVATDEDDEFLENVEDVVESFDFNLWRGNFSGIMSDSGIIDTLWLLSDCMMLVDVNFLYCLRTDIKYALEDKEIILL